MYSIQVYWFKIEKNVKRHRLDLDFYRINLIFTISSHSFYLIFFKMKKVVVVFSFIGPDPFSREK